MLEDGSVRLTACETWRCGVELDSYCNTGYDPNGKHIAIVKDSIRNHLCHTMDDRTDDSSWHTIKAVYKKGTLKVYLDGKQILTQAGIELADQVYLGISAATGGGRNEQKFRKFIVS